MDIIKHQHRKICTGIFEASVEGARGLLGVGGQGGGRNGDGNNEAVTVRKEASEGEGEGNDSGSAFAILTTGYAWQEPLDTAVRNELLPPSQTHTFAGVECVGLNAGDLHPDEPQAQPIDPGAAASKISSPVASASFPSPNNPVETKVRAAATRLLSNPNVGVIILGCAGMVGMDTWVRETAKEMGRDGVKVVDGVKAGVGALEGWVRMEA